MDIIFEANFATVGTPDIRIYSVIEGSYALVKTDTMTATAETGKYTYKFLEGDVVTDYSARMSLDEENIDGVYNSIFNLILGRSGGGGGGSVVYSKMSKEQVKKIVDMSKELFINALNDINVSLPADLGKKEIEDAIKTIKETSNKSANDLQKRLDAAIEKKIKELSIQADNNYDELIGVVEDFLYDEKAPIQNEVIVQKDQELEKKVSGGLEKLEKGIKTVEKVSRKGVDSTVIIKQLLTAVKEQSKMQEKGMVVLLKEILK